MSVFPNVPIAPGVPPVLRNPASVVTTVSLLVADAIRLFNGSFLSVWGIYQNGIPVIEPDSIVAFDFKQSWLISDYPVEQGAFQSYDKVQTPFEVRIRMSKGGSVLARQGFLNNVIAIVGTLALYDIVTPDAIYRSANITSWDYRRTAANGVGMIVVDMTLVEVRVTATTQFSNTQAPSGANSTFIGPVQPETPTATQSNTLPQVER